MNVMDRKNPLQRGLVSSKPIKTLFELRPEEEYIHLWESIVTLLDDSIKLIRFYEQLGMPGIPIEDLKQNQKTLSLIIERYNND